MALVAREEGFVKWVAGDEVEMRQIFVKKEFRNKGVGKELMKEFYKIPGRKITYSSSDETNPFFHFLKAEGWKRVDWHKWIK